MFGTHFAHAHGRTVWLHAVVRPGISWKMVRAGQLNDIGKSMGTLTRADGVRLPDLEPREPPKRWLGQWMSHSMASLHSKTFLFQRVVQFVILRPAFHCSSFLFPFAWMVM